jgi:hypothetical protein
VTAVYPDFWRVDTPTIERFPLAPLLDLAGMSGPDLARTWGHAPQYFIHIEARGGLNVEQVELWSERLGVHPAYLYPHQWCAIEPKETHV